jgi:IS1 family transposase
VIGVKVKTIYGDEREVLLLLGASTSYVERTNLTSRHMNGRLVRKTMGYSKELEDAQSVLDLGRCGLQPGPGTKDA